VVTAAPAPQPAPPSTEIRVALDILTTCGIHDAPSGSTSPLFAFDSSALSSDDQRLLDDVATCLSTGPLAGRALKLIGRADPRGTEAYNMSLGDRRASRVGSYLALHGMITANLGESSRGALDATGSDESGWAMDRRVDVDLAAAEPVASIP
jgi:peptidoglycan-associated lipoprotein